MMRAGRLGAPRPRRATSPASRPRRTIGTRRPAGRAARSRDSGRQRAPGTLASSRRPARSPRMANCSRSTCGRSGRLGRGRPLPAARYVERRAGTHAIERSSSYGRASTRSTAGRDTRAARRRAAARLRRVSSVSRFARLRISQFQRKHTGWRDGYAWVARRSSQGSLRPHVSRVARRRPHPNMTDRPLPPVVTVATSARARRTLRFVSERQLSARPIVGDNCERLRGNTNPAGRRAFPGAAA